MVDNQAAASLTPVDKEKMSPPLPVVPVPVPVDDKVVKQMALLVDVDVKPPSSLSIPPLAVMPADTTNKQTPTLVAVLVRFVVCPWALLNAFVFAVGDIATLILNRTPCTKSTWLFRCVTLTDAAAAELSLLLYGELLCSAAAALPALLHMVLATRMTDTSRMRSRWGAVVDALAWVALAATAATHCMEVASDRISLAAEPGDNYIFGDVVLVSIYFAVDLLVGILLCCRPCCRLELVDDEEVV